MRVLFIALVLASLTACSGKRAPIEHVPDGPSLASMPCDPALVAAILAGDEAFSKAQRQYLDRCGVKFAG